MSAQSTKKKRFGSRRRLANQSETSEGGDGFHAVAGYHIPEENTESSIGLTNYSESDCQHPPAPEVTHNRRKLGSSRRNKGRQAKDSGIESHQGPTEEVVENAESNEALQDKIITMPPSDDDMESASHPSQDFVKTDLSCLQLIHSENQSDASNSENNYHEHRSTENMTKTTVDELPIRDEPTSKMQSKIETTKQEVLSHKISVTKSEIQEVDHHEKESDCELQESDVCESVNNKQGGMDKPHTLQSEEGCDQVTENAHLVDITELQSFTSDSVSPAAQPLGDQSNSNEMPDEELTNVYSVTDQRGEKREEDTELQSEKNVHDNCLVKESHIKAEETEFPIKRVITTEKSSPAESNESVSVVEETLSSTEEPTSKEKHDEHEVEVVQQSEVRKPEVKSTQMEEMHQNLSSSECVLHDAPEIFDVNLGNLMDNVEIGNTHQLELILETLEDSVEKQDESKPDSKESQNVKDNNPTMAPPEVTSGQDDFLRANEENAENVRKTSEETENGSNLTEYEEIPKMEPHPTPEASLCRDDYQISDIQNVSDHVEETVEHDTIEDLAEMREIDDTEAEVTHFEQGEVGEQCENPTNTEYGAQEINASHELTCSEFFPAVQTKTVLSDTSAGFEICHKENPTEFPEPAMDVAEKSAISNTGDTDDVGQNQEVLHDKTQDREDSTENVQIKSKQRRRKMGSTRRVLFKHEEETQSKDQKSDLNTEADTGNRCSSEAELETQAEPEFSAGDLHVELKERDKVAIHTTQTAQVNPSNTSLVEVGGFCKSDGEEITANDPQTAGRTMKSSPSLLSGKDDDVTEAVKGKMEVMDAEASQHETSTTSLSRMCEQEQETNDTALGLVCEGSKTAGESTKRGSTEKHLSCEEENTEKMKEGGAVWSQNVKDNSPTMATTQVTVGQDDFLRSTEENEENKRKTSEESENGSNLKEYEEIPKMEPHPAPEASLCREDCQISEIENVSDHVEETVEHDTIEDLAEMRESYDTEAEVPHFEQDEVGEQCENPTNTEYGAQEINASHELTCSEFFPAVQTKTVLSDTSAGFEICHKENTTEFPEPAVDVAEKSAISNTGDTDDVGQNQEGLQNKTQDREDYNENVQIKSKQRRRKMGSTRRVLLKHEEETESRDGKSDLNTEADTGNRCSSEAELETQAEPEFSAGDLHVELEERDKTAIDTTQTVQVNPSNTSLVEFGGFCKSDGEEITANDPQTAGRTMKSSPSLLSGKDDDVTEAVKGKMEVMDAEASQHETSTTSLSRMCEQEQETNDTALGLVCEGGGQVEEDQYNAAEHTMHQEEERLFSEDEESKSSLQTLQSVANIPLFSRPQEHSVSTEEQTNMSSKTAGESTKRGSTERHLRCEEENTEKMKEGGAVWSQNVKDNSSTMATTQVTSGQDDFLRSTEENEENKRKTSEESENGGNLKEYEEIPKMEPHPAPEASLCREDCQISEIENVSDHVEETVEHDTIKDLAEMREIDDTEAEVPHFEQDEVGEQCENPTNTEHRAQEINASHELTCSEFFPAVQTKTVLSDTSAGFEICHKENTTEFPELAVDVSEKSAISNTGDTDDVGQNQEGLQDKTQDREDSTKNVQIKSKQRRRKMGSTRRVLLKHEEETESRDGKSDLNTEADTGNRCSSEAELETQAEPEFSAGDLHVELEERDKVAIDTTQTVQVNPSNTSLVEVGGFCKSDGEEITAKDSQTAGRTMKSSPSLLSGKDDDVTEAVKGKMEVMDAEASQHETSTTSLSRMCEQEQETNNTALGLVCEGEGQVEEDQYNTAEHMMHQEEEQLFSEDEDSKSSLQTLQSVANIPLFSRPQEHSVSTEEQTNMSSKTAGESTKRGSTERHLRCEEENTEKMKEGGAVWSQNVKDNSPTMATTQVTSGQDDFLRSTEENEENKRKTSEESENGSNLKEYEEIPKMEPHPTPEDSLCREDCQISEIENVSDHVEETVEHDTIEDLAEMRESYDIEAEVPHFEQDEVGEQCENPTNKEHRAQEINASHELTCSEFFPAVQTKNVLSDTSTGFEICHKENTTEFSEPAVDVAEKSAISNTGDTDDVGQNQEGLQDKTQDREDYTKNVQIKSKQRRRKMGSTRRVLLKHEEETESRDGKSDLNTEADTGNRCSSEAELETQAEPEFSADDLHVELEERDKAAIDTTQTVQVNPSNTSLVEFGGFCKSDGEEITANDPQTAGRTMKSSPSLLSGKDDDVTEAVKGKMEVMDAEASQHETSTTSLSRMCEQEQETNDTALGLVCEGSKTAGESTKRGSTEKHLSCEEENTEKMKEGGAVWSQNVKDNSPTMATTQVTVGQDDFLRSTEENEENKRKTSEESENGSNLKEYEEIPKMEPHPAPEASLCREDCQISEIENVSDHVEETVEHDTIEDLAEMRESYDIEAEVPHFEQDEVGEQCENPTNKEHRAQEINASHELTCSEFFPAVQTKNVLSDTSTGFEICHKENTTEFPEPAVDVAEKSAISNTGDTDDVGQNQEVLQDKTQDREDSTKNVQIKSKQRRRKMGSTRRVLLKHEEETESRDGKSDLNTEADTGNRCSSEAELKTQAGPEFSAVDLHVELEERDKAAIDTTQTVQVNLSNTSLVEFGGFCKSDGEEITANDPQTAGRTMKSSPSLLSGKDDDVTEAVKGKMEVMDAEASQHETSTTSLSRMCEQEQETNDTALSLVCKGGGQVEEDQYNTAEHTMHQEEERLFSEDEESKSSLQTLQSVANIPLFSRPQEHSVSTEEQTNMSSKTAGESTKRVSTERHLRCEEENTEKMKEGGAFWSQNVKDNSSTMATTQVTSGQDVFLRSTEENEENKRKTSEESENGSNLKEYEEIPKMEPHPAPEASLCREDCQISEIENVSDHVEETVEHDTIEDLAEMRESYDTEAEVPHFEQDEVGEQCENPTNTEYGAQEINASHELTCSEFFPAVQTKTVLSDTSAGFEICHKENTTEFPEPAVDVAEKSAISNTGDTDDVGQNQEVLQDKTQDREDSTKNVQIKSKQRRRKMGSTRRVLLKHEEETESRDGKSDLNTEADTGNRCSSEAELKTQAGPEFSAGDLHVELEERDKAAIDTTQTVQVNLSNTSLVEFGGFCKSDGEEITANDPQTAGRTMKSSPSLLSGKDDDVTEAVKGKMEVMDAEASQHETSTTSLSRMCEQEQETNDTALGLVCKGGGQVEEDQYNTAEHTMHQEEERLFSEDEESKSSLQTLQSVANIPLFSRPQEHSVSTEEQTNMSSKTAGESTKRVSTERHLRCEEENTEKMKEGGAFWSQNVKDNSSTMATTQVTSGQDVFLRSTEENEENKRKTSEESENGGNLKEYEEIPKMEPHPAPEASLCREDCQISEIENVSDHVEETVEHDTIKDLAEMREIDDTEAEVPHFEQDEVGEQCENPTNTEHGAQEINASHELTCSEFFPTVQTKNVLSDTSAGFEICHKENTTEFPEPAVDVAEKSAISNTGDTDDVGQNQEVLQDKTQDREDSTKNVQIKSKQRRRKMGSTRRVLLKHEEETESRDGKSDLNTEADTGNRCSSEAELKTQAGPEFSAGDLHVELEERDKAAIDTTQTVQVNLSNTSLVEFGGFCKSDGEEITANDPQTAGRTMKSSPSLLSGKDDDVTEAVKGKMEVMDAETSTTSLSRMCEQEQETNDTALGLVCEGSKTAGESTKRGSTEKHLRCEEENTEKMKEGGAVWSQNVKDNSPTMATTKVTSGQDDFLRATSEETENGSKISAISNTGDTDDVDQNQEGLQDKTQDREDYNENVQIKSKQRRRKMGSTRKVHWKHEEETESKDVKGDLNTEAEPEFSASDLHVEQEERDKAAIDTTQTVQLNPSGLDFLSSGSPAASHGEDFGVPAAFVQPAGVRDGEENVHNVDVSVSPSQLDVITNTETHTTCSPSQLLPPNTEKYITADPAPQDVEEEVAPVIEVARAEVREESGEKDKNAPIDTPKLNNMSETAHGANAAMQNASQDSTSANRRRKMGSTRKNLRSKAEDLHKRQGDGEAMETAKNPGDEMTESVSDVKGKEPDRKHEEQEKEQAKEQSYTDSRLTPLSLRSAAENAVACDQIVEAERRLSTPDLHSKPALSARHDALSESSSGGRRRKMGSHRKTGGHKPTGRRDGGEPEGDAETLEERIEESDGVDKTSEVAETDNAASSNISISTTREPLKPAGLLERKEKEPVHSDPEVHQVQKREKRQFLGDTKGSDLRSNSYNVVMVGNSSVGKTSFMKTAQTGTFSSDVSSSLGIDSCKRTVSVDGKTVVIQLWDTAGQERFHSITRQIFHKAQAFLLMYDITSSQSFSAVRYWADCIQGGAAESVIVMLLGNKSDCAERQVQRGEGEVLAKAYNFAFDECSAATGDNVLGSLESLASGVFLSDKGHNMLWFEGHDSITPSDPKEAAAETLMQHFPSPQ